MKNLLRIILMGLLLSLSPLALAHHHYYRHHHHAYYHHRHHPHFWWGWR